MTTRNYRVISTPTGFEIREQPICPECHGTTEQPGDLCGECYREAMKRLLGYVRGNQTTPPLR